MVSRNPHLPVDLLFEGLPSDCPVVEENFVTSLEPKLPLLLLPLVYPSRAALRLTIHALVLRCSVSMLEVEMALDKLAACVKSLKQQRISVSRGMVGEDGFVFEVMGFMLTGSQILKLCEYGQLNAEGISAFSKSVEGDPMARRPFRKGSPIADLRWTKNARFHILAGNRRPLGLSVGSELLRVSRRWRSNSSPFSFCAHVIHVFRVHWKTRSRIMVGFALSGLKRRRACFAFRASRMLHPTFLIASVYR